MNVLVTGGAGFIGTHLVRRLLSEHCNVTILDNFSPQIHGTNDMLPPDIQGRVRLIRGDVRDREIVGEALHGQDTVVHLAAETGTGQSMYEIERYADVNVNGTAVLFDVLINKKTAVRKVVVASSRAIYGEGKYACGDHGVVFPGRRRAEDLKKGQFEPKCPVCGMPCSMLATDESAKISPTSFYGITKQVQEQMALMFGESLGISAFALRYQNVYGPGQSLNNPYTGILAIFSNQARANKPIYIFEDGRESRDFVYIDDVIEATWRCAQAQSVGVAALNVGSGERTTVLEVARHIVDYFGSASSIEVNGAFRDGDIRHNVADLSNVREFLGYEAQTSFSEGIRKFLAWTQSQEVSIGKYEQSLLEMQKKGLMYG
jgi:dTDP-L-rhamnose 4-epimerase